MSMVARNFRFCTQPVHSATKRSNAAITVRGEEHTGTICSAGNSPWDFRHWSTILDAGKMKSSTSSWNHRKPQPVKQTGRMHQTEWKFQCWACQQCRFLTLTSQLKLMNTATHHPGGQSPGVTNCRNTVLISHSPEHTCASWVQVLVTLWSKRYYSSIFEMSKVPVLEVTFAVTLWNGLPTSCLQPCFCHTTKRLFTVLVMRNRIQVHNSKKHFWMWYFVSTPCHYCGQQSQSNMVNGMPQQINSILKWTAFAWQTNGRWGEGRGRQAVVTPFLLQRKQCLSHRKEKEKVKEDRKKWREKKKKKKRCC